MNLAIDNAEETCLKNRNDSSNTADPQEKLPISNSLNVASRSLPEKDESVIKEQRRPPSDDPNEELKDDFPEGGVQAWSVVLGSFCGLFAVFGIINSTAVFQEYFSTHQLSQYSPSQIGWIFSVQLFLSFFSGGLIGPVFDARGPRLLVFGGSVFLVASMMLLGLCTHYWHFLLIYSVIGAFGGCFMNIPAMGCISHFFLAKRGNAVGVAMTSGSIGGVIFPLMLQKLIPAVGFAWATRILGFILLFLVTLANLLIRSRLPRKKGGSALPDLTVLKDPAFAIVTLGAFLLEWAIFVPLTYVSSYAVAHGQNAAFGSQLIAILNAGSFFGRLLAGWISDKIGRFNTLIITITLCVITNLALWLPAGDSKPLLIVYSLLFGFASGSNLSLLPVCVGQLCKTEKYGRAYGTCWMIGSLGTLTGVPIAGQILAVNNGSYYGLIIFAGMSYAGALICIVVVRFLAVGYKANMIY